MKKVSRHLSSFGCSCGFLTFLIISSSANVYLFTLQRHEPLGIFNLSILGKANSVRIQFLNNKVQVRTYNCLLIIDDVYDWTTSSICAEVCRVPYLIWVTWYICRSRPRGGFFLAIQRPQSRKHLPPPPPPTKPTPGAAADDAPNKALARSHVIYWSEFVFLQMRTQYYRMAPSMRFYSVILWI